MNLGFIITFIYIQIANPEINWIRYPLSRYYYTHDGYILVTGLFLIAISEIFTAQLIYKERVPENNWLRILVFFMGLSALIIAIFPMNLIPEKSVHGFVHMIAAAVQFFLFPVVTIYYGIQKGRSQLGFIYLIYGVVSSFVLLDILRILVTLAPVDQIYYGLIQKIYILLIVIWLIMISLSTLQKEKNIYHPDKTS